MQIDEFVSLDCDAEPKGERIMDFKQAFVPLLVLGGKKDISPFLLRNETKDISDEKHNLLIRFRCPDEWLVYYNPNPTVNPDDYEVHDDQNCLAKDKKYLTPEY